MTKNNNIRNIFFLLLGIVVIYLFYTLLNKPSTKKEIQTKALHKPVLPATPIIQKKKNVVPPLVGDTNITNNRPIKIQPLIKNDHPITDTISEIKTIQNSTKKEEKQKVVEKVISEPHTLERDISNNADSQREKTRQRIFNNAEAARAEAMKALEM